MKNTQTLKHQEIKIQMRITKAKTHIMTIITHNKKIKEHNTNTTNNNKHNEETHTDEQTKK